MLTNLGDCTCDAGGLETALVCPGTPFTIVPNVSTCVGTVTLKAIPTVLYDCFPIAIPKAKYAICVSCKCSFIGVVITQLPINGTLTLRGVPVTVGQVISEADNGMILLVKTPLFVGADTYKFKVTTSCGDSLVKTVNVTYSNKDCTVVPCLTC